MLRTKSNSGLSIFHGVGTLASIVAISTVAFPWFSLEVKDQGEANYAIVAGRDLQTSLTAIGDFTWLAVCLLILWVVAGLWMFGVAAGKSSSKILGVVYFGSGAAGMIAGASLIAGAGAPAPGSMFVWSPALGLTVAIGACFAQSLCGVMLLNRPNSVSTKHV